LSLMNKSLCDLSDRMQALELKSNKPQETS